MKLRAIAGLGLSAFLLGGTMVGCTHGGQIASAGTRSDAAIARQATSSADKAKSLIAKGDATKAVSFAETAVALRPQDAGYRALLGQAYLKAGRFASAHAAFADVLSLTPGDGRAALNLALSQIAEGDWAAARETLSDNARAIPAADHGLALALAGDPAGAVALLVSAVRSPDADVKARQNLALALALSGRWKDAREVAGMDLAPIEADKRIVEWMGFAQPVAASDQVAALLGVRPVEDPGQPVALALKAAGPAEAPVALAALEPVAETPATFVEAPQTVAAPRSEMSETSGVQFAARREVVQDLPGAVPQTISSQGAFKTLVAAPMLAAHRAARTLATPERGAFYVQLGAFDSASVAKDAWDRAQRRYTALSKHEPTGMTFETGARSFYRLSVGGFARADANALCGAYRARGGACFVRAGAGDQMALWLRPDRVQLAAR